MRLFVDRQAHAQPKLGVVFKQRVGPGRSAPLQIDRIRRGGQIASIDGRAAGGIRDQSPVAEQLRQQLDIRRLPAAGAGARKLEQRLQQLHVFDVMQRQSFAIELRQVEEELPIAAFLFPDGRLRRQVDGLLLGFALAFRRAHLHA